MRIACHHNLATMSSVAQHSYEILINIQAKLKEGKTYVMAHLLCCCVFFLSVGSRGMKGIAHMNVVEVLCTQEVLLHVMSYVRMVQY